jgi:hypothetical protein
MNEIKSGSEVEILPSFAFGEDGTKCYPDAHEVGKIAVVTDVLGNGEYAIKTKEGGIYWARENDIRLPTKRAADHPAIELLHRFYDAWQSRADDEIIDALVLEMGAVLKTAGGG